MVCLFAVMLIAARDFFTIPQAVPSQVQEQVSSNQLTHVAAREFFDSGFQQVKKQLTSTVFHRIAAGDVANLALENGLWCAVVCEVQRCWEASWGACSEVTDF